MTCHPDIQRRADANEYAIRTALVAGPTVIAVASDLAEEHARRLRMRGHSVEIRPFTRGPFNLQELWIDCV